MYKLTFLREKNLDNSVKEGCRSKCWKLEARVAETLQYSGSHFMFNQTYFKFLKQGYVASRRLYAHKLLERLHKKPIKRKLKSLNLPSH